MNQKFDVTSTIGSDPTIPVFDSVVKMKNDYWGFGLRGGFDTQWGFVRGDEDGWNIYASFAATLFYGEFDLSHSHSVAEQQFPVAAQIDAIDVNVSKKYKSGKAMTDMDIGLMYERVFGNDFGLAVKLGWEHHGIYNINQFQRFVDENAMGNVVHNYF